MRPRVLSSSSRLCTGSWNRRIITLQGVLDPGLHALQRTPEDHRCAQVVMEDGQSKTVTPEPSPAPSPVPSPVPSPLLDKISLPAANHVEVCCKMLL